MCRSILAWLAVALFTACQVAVPVETRSLMGRDGRTTEVSFEAAQPRRSDVAQAAAISAALAHLKVTDPAIAADGARFVVLSVRTPDDGVVALSRRRAWWVTVKGERFPVAACMCDGSPFNLGTAVVVDAESGQALTTIGISRENE